MEKKEKNRNQGQKGPGKTEQKNLLESIGEELQLHLEEERKDREKEIEELKKKLEEKRRKSRNIMVDF